MTILGRRQQQANFAAALALNRAASTGTGAGLKAMQLLASQMNIPGQTIVGTNGPPFGRSGGGGRLTVDTITFTPTRTSDVLLVGLVHGLVNTAPLGPQVTQSPVYFRIDGTVNDQNMSLPDYGPAGGAQYNGTAVMFVVVSGMTPTSHTVVSEWNPVQGVKDTLQSYFDAIFAFQLSA